MVQRRRVGQIIAIDPGTTHTGMVYMTTQGSVLDVDTANFYKALNTDNEALIIRCTLIWLRISAFLESHPHSMVVIEGYKPYGGMRVARATSHQTPWLIGHITACLGAAGEPFTVQLSDAVLRKNRGGMGCVLEGLKDGSVKFNGSNLLSNEHLRTAAMHGLYYVRNRH